jgi:hypothetical protein
MIAGRTRSKIDAAFIYKTIWFVTLKDYILREYYEQINIYLKVLLEQTVT